MLMLSEPVVSREDLAQIGMESLAYIRPVTINGRCFHIIHAADGRPISVATDRELAFIAVRQHEMNPVSIH